MLFDEQYYLDVDEYNASLDEYWGDDPDQYPIEPEEQGRYLSEVGEGEYPW